MGLARVVIACIAIGYVTIYGANAKTSDESIWLRSRAREFAAWSASHSSVSSEIVKLKGDTAELIAHESRQKLSAAQTLIWRVPGAVTQLWDAPEAPKLAIIPAGQFRMGSPASEVGRFPNEVQHRVTIAYPFAVGIYDVTRAEFAAFVAETHYDAETGGCFAYDSGSFVKRSDRNWESPGFDQSDVDPVVCVSRNDAKAYLAWLTHRTGHVYRLPSESEWEYAARAGSVTARPWGEVLTHDQANYGTDACCKPFAQGRDRWLYTSPSGSFAANAFGLYDMLGNVWQLTEDCYVKDYSMVPDDGRPAASENCRLFMARGSSWTGYQRYVRSALRNWGGPNTRNSSLGFRVARSL